MFEYLLMVTSYKQVEQNAQYSGRSDILKNIQIFKLKGC